MNLEVRAVCKYLDAQRLGAILGVEVTALVKFETYRVTTNGGKLKLFNTAEALYAFLEGVAESDSFKEGK